VEGCAADGWADFFRFWLIPPFVPSSAIVVVVVIIGGEGSAGVHPIG